MKALGELLQVRSGRPRPWTRTEHLLFLVGLEACGQGYWREIASQYLHSRTPTQIASHAQKYRIRQEEKASKPNSRRWRPSIHDITTEVLEPVGPARDRMVA